MLSDPDLPGEQAATTIPKPADRREAVRAAVGAVPAVGPGDRPEPDAAPARRSAVGRAVGSFLPSSMPLMARRNYRRELGAASLLPFLLAAVEGGILGVVVKRGFEAQVDASTLNLAVAAITASPNIANLTSFIWVRASHGLGKTRFITAAHAVMALCVVGLSLMPRTAAGLAGTVGLALAARVCWAGFVTLRSTVWSQNYTRSVRGRVTGKFATVQVILVGVLGLLMGSAMDRDPSAYRWLLPASAALGLAGAWVWSGVRVRGRRSLLSAERADVGHDRPSFSPASIGRVLRADRRFAVFMACMFLLGAGNLMLDAVLILVQRDRFGLGYLGGILVTTTVPLAMMPFMIPVWARLLDRGHVVRFRSIHAWFFVASTGLILVASRLDALWLLYAAVAVEGMAFAGGVLAWNLGHLDFAPAHKASQYMGVHVTLTGVRGSIAPFAGVLLYQWFESLSPGAGTWTVAVCLALCVGGAMGFVLLARAMEHAPASPPRPAA